MPGIIYQIIKHLDSIEAYGEKKFKVGKEAPKGIHSRRTKEVYEKVALAFGKWCKERGITGGSFRGRFIEMANEYLAERVSREDLSAWTLHLDQCALKKLAEAMNFDRELVGCKLPERRLDHIKRSRSVSEEERSTLAYRLIAATGLRRDEAERARVRHVVTEDNGKMFIYVPRGKGGRERHSPVVDEALVKKAIEGKEPGDKLYDTLPRQAHAARRDYAKRVFEIASKGLGKDFDAKAALSDVTQALGHNRLRVARDHYLRESGKDKKECDQGQSEIRSPGEIVDVTEEGANKRFFS